MRCDSHSKLFFFPGTPLSQISSKKKKKSFRQTDFLLFDKQDTAHTDAETDGHAGSLYLDSIHEALPVAGPSPGNIRQRLALSHAGDHGGAALHRRHVLQLGDVRLDCRPQSRQIVSNRWKMKGRRCAFEARTRGKGLGWSL